MSLELIHFCRCLPQPDGFAAIASSIRPTHRRHILEMKYGVSVLVPPVSGSEVSPRATLLWIFIVLPPAQPSRSGEVRFVAVCL